MLCNRTRAKLELRRMVETLGDFGKTKWVQVSSSLNLRFETLGEQKPRPKERNRSLDRGHLLAGLSPSGRLLVLSIKANSDWGKEQLETPALRTQLPLVVGKSYLPRALPAAF